jgi:hypothetical protein
MRIWTKRNQAILSSEEMAALERENAEAIRENARPSAPSTSERISDVDGTSNLTGMSNFRITRLPRVEEDGNGTDNSTL